MTDLLLPEGTRLLHIGPAQDRDDSAAGRAARGPPSTCRPGVVYPGQASARAGRARGYGSGHGAEPRRPRSDDGLGRPVREVEAGRTDERVIISSESFATATAEHGARRSSMAWAATRSMSW